VLLEERVGGCVVERGEPQFVEAGAGDGVAANGEEHHDRVGGQSPGYEREHVRCRRVQEVGVVRDDEQRRVRGGVGEKLERCEGDAERVGDFGGLEPERRKQVPPVHGAELVDRGQDRGEQMVQAGERHARLGLDPAGRQHGHRPLSRRVDDRIEQRRLADASVTPNDACAPRACRRAVEHVGEDRQLRVAPVKPRAAICCGTRGPFRRRRSLHFGDRTTATVVEIRLTAAVPHTEPGTTAACSVC
jgi:hypothetical protein